MGTLNKQTILERRMEEAVKIVAKANNISEEEAWVRLHQKGITEALKGNFNFYQDVLNRYYGKMIEKFDHTTKGESLNYDNEQRAKIAERIIRREQPDGAGGAE